MYTLPFPPLCTLMLPEPETISRSTAPETCNVRSKVPVSEACSGSVTTAANSPATARSLRDFILFLLKGQPKIFPGSCENVRFPSGLRSLRASRPRDDGRVCSLPLLQYDLLSFFQPTEQFGLGAIGDAHCYCDFLFALFGRGIRNFDRCITVFVIDQSAFRDHEDSLVIFQDNLRVGSHHGFEFTLGVINGDPHLKSGDIVLLHSHRGNLGYFSVERAVSIGLNLNACRLAQIDFGNIAFVYLALNVNLMCIAQRHQQCG